MHTRWPSCTEHNLTIVNENFHVNIFIDKWTLIITYDACFHTVWLCYVKRVAFTFSNRLPKSIIWTLTTYEWHLQMVYYCIVYTDNKQCTETRSRLWSWVQQSHIRTHTVKHQLIEYNKAYTCSVLGHALAPSSQPSRVLTIKSSKSDRFVALCNTANDPDICAICQLKGLAKLWYVKAEYILQFMARK